MRNAYIFRHCQIPLRNQGLVQVRGLNLDDGGFLGVGKSSMFNGFSRIQLGKSGKKDKADEIVFDKVGKDLCNILKMKKNGVPYEIRQYRKHSTYGTRVEVVNLDTGVNELPDEARKHPHKWIKDVFLLTDDNIFFNTTYLTQSWSSNLLDGKESDRKQHLTSMFDLDIFDDLLAQVKSRMRIVQESVGKATTLQEDINQCTEELSELGNLKTIKRKFKRAASRAKASQAGFYVSNKELVRLQDLHANLKLRYNTQQDVKALWEEHPELTEMFPSIDRITIKRLGKLNKKLETIASKKASAQNKAEQARRRLIITSQLKRINTELSDVTSPEKAQDELDNIKTRLHHLSAVELPAAESREDLLGRLQALNDVPPNITKLKREYEDLQISTSHAENQIKRLSHKVANGVCSECGQTIDMDAAELKTLKRKLRTTRQQLELDRKKVFNLKSTIETSDKREKLQTKIDASLTSRDAGAINKEIKKLRKKEKRLATAVELLKQQDTLKAQLSSLPQDEPEQYEEKAKLLRKSHRNLTRIHRFAEKIQNLSEQLVKLPDGDYREVGKSISQLSTDIRSLGKSIKTWSHRETNLKNKLRRIRIVRSKLKKLKIDLKSTKKARTELDCLTTLKHSFGPNGLKKDRFRSILAEATETTIPIYSSILWPNKQIELQLTEDDGLQFYLKRKNKKDLTVGHLLSGGESHKAGIALLLGLRDLKEMYTDTKCNLLIIDEPFGNLDPQGEEGLLAVLELLKDRFESIFVISHRPEVIHSSVWDQTWWVIREDNESVLWKESPPLKYQKLARSFMTADGGL